MCLPFLFVTLVFYLIFLNDFFQTNVFWDVWWILFKIGSDGYEPEKEMLVGKLIDRSAVCQLIQKVHVR